MVRLAMRRQNLSEDNGIVVRLVMSSIDKRDRTFACQFAQSVEFIAMPVDLRRISPAELLPAGWKFANWRPRASSTG